MILTLIYPVTQMSLCHPVVTFNISVDKTNNKKKNKIDNRHNMRFIETIALYIDMLKSILLQVLRVLIRKDDITYCNILINIFYLWQSTYQNNYVNALFFCIYNTLNTHLIRFIAVLSKF